MTVDGDRTWAASGVRDLTLLKTTGSEFHGFLKDEHTTLPETWDRILATSLLARWRHAQPEGDWDGRYADVRRTLTETFATKHSHALQETLYAMGHAALEVHPGVAEIRFSAPNNHHVRYDTSPFGLDNPGLVFHAADRPYGLIEATVTRDDAPDPRLAWPAR